MTRGGRSTSHFKDLFRGGTIFKRHRTYTSCSYTRLAADARLNFNFASRITRCATSTTCSIYTLHSRRCFRHLSLESSTTLMFEIFTILFAVDSTSSKCNNAIVCYRPLYIMYNSEWVRMLHFLNLITDSLSFSFSHFL